ncbi:MAG: hypothetical protein JNL98_33075 [Bryobacterales bacterium]|nr:hypothetical protein [Bryobacterales bacterium]
MSRFIPCAIVATLLGAALHAQQPKPVEIPLRAKVEAILFPLADRDSNSPTLSDRLRKLGPENEVRDILLQILTDYRSVASLTHTPTQREKLQQYCFQIAILALGEFREQRAWQPVADVMARRDLPTVYLSYSARALGQIDAVRSKEILLTAFDLSAPSEMGLRRAIGRALIETRDPKVLAKLEAHARGEMHPLTRKSWDAIVADMRRKMGLP